MAFHQPALHRPSLPTASPQPPQQPFVQRSAPVEDSQEWVLFSPASKAESSTQRTATTRTAGLSRASELGSLNTAARSGQVGSSILEEEDATEDAELDSLDDGLHAFREPALYQTQTNQSHGALLPAHDGLGTFQASSAPVLEQLWQHEQYNPKRKHEGHHRSASSVQRQLDIVDDLDAQASEEKRMRIEKWRIEQSQALMEEVERETRRRLRRESSLAGSQEKTVESILGSTPKQSDFTGPKDQGEAESDNEPFWRRITRKFIRDIIGIDEPLLSVILGESLPGESTPRPSSPVPLASIPEKKEAEELVDDSTWRSRLLQRIAKELGVYVHQITPHPGAFTTYQQSNADYAGMPVHLATPEQQHELPTTDTPSIPIQDLASTLSPNFPPTIRDPVHAHSWGFEEEPTMSSVDSILNLREEREYWERELDLKRVFRFLSDRFGSSDAPSTAPSQPLRQDDSARRAAIIRQHHPLIARAHRSPARLRRDSRLSIRRASSSCASESLKGSRRASALRSGSSRNYWDLGHSGSSSVGPSGGMLGAWGEV